MDFSVVLENFAACECDKLLSDIMHGISVNMCLRWVKQTDMLTFLKSLTHPVCNARFYYCYYPGHRCILPIFGYSFQCPSAREILLIDMAERMQLEVSDSEEALNITGDNLSGDEYADRPAVNAYGSPVNVSRIEPRLAVIQSPDPSALLSLVW